LKSVVVKLGGSVITDKSKPMTPNRGEIDRLVREIALAHVDRLVVVHGGGSFGHPVAQRYGIKDGLKEPGQLLGFSMTRQAMVALNQIIVEALIKEKVPSVGVPPSAIAVTRDGRIQFLRWSLLRRMLGLGLMPVLYGDAVLDTKLGFTILSGDQLAARLALALGSKLAVFGVDVDGLYTSDPKVDPNARLLETVGPRRLKTMLSAMGGSLASDVTGGMKGKMRESLPLVRKGIRVQIVNACVPGNLYKALVGERVWGTVLGENLE